MNDKPSVILKAFGAAGFITCLYGLVIASFFPSEMWQIPVAFILCFTFVLSQPSEIFYSSRERWNLHLLEVAELRAKRDGLAAPVSASGGGAVTVANVATNGESWADYYIGWLSYAKDKNSITFNANAEYFGTVRAAALETWNRILRPLINDGLVLPVEKGLATRVAPPNTIETLITFFETGHNLKPQYLPPWHPPAPFTSLEGVTETTAETANNTQ